jgi:SAM-dependent methyltransferase
MTKKAFEIFAQHYDLIYNDKDYFKEADFIEECIKYYSKTKKVLEIGCGTGNYTKIFSDKGYKITGIDISEKMLELARKKCDCTFLNMDVRNLFLPHRFDCCLALFAVMGYVTDNSDVTKALKNIRNHLYSHGLLVFDVWNGLAVLRNLPESRIKEVENDEFKIVRFAHPTLKAIDHICEVDYKLVVENKGLNQFSVIDEKHRVRFFFPKEIEYYLQNCGFELLKICPFLNFNGKVDENIWNMTIIARAV